MGTCKAPVRAVPADCGRRLVWLQMASSPAFCCLRNYCIPTTMQAAASLLPQGAPQRAAQPEGRAQARAAALRSRALRPCARVACGGDAAAMRDQRQAARAPAVTAGGAAAASLTPSRDRPLRWRTAPPAPPAAPPCRPRAAGAPPQLVCSCGAWGACMAALTWLLPHARPVRRRPCRRRRPRRQQRCCPAVLAASFLHGAPGTAIDRYRCGCCHRGGSRPLRAGVPVHALPLLWTGGAAADGEVPTVDHPLHGRRVDFPDAHGSSGVGSTPA